MEQCSATTPHTEHTWGGRPMCYCPGLVADPEENKSAVEHFFDARAPFHWNKGDVLRIMVEYAEYVKEVQ